MNKGQLKKLLGMLAAEKAQPQRPASKGEELDALKWSGKEADVTTEAVLKDWLADNGLEGGASSSVKVPREIHSTPGTMAADDANFDAAWEKSRAARDRLRLSNQEAMDTGSQHDYYTPAARSPTVRNVHRAGGKPIFEFGWDDLPSYQGNPDSFNSPHKDMLRDSLRNRERDYWRAVEDPDVLPMSLGKKLLGVLAAEKAQPQRPAPRGEELEAPSPTEDRYWRLHPARLDPLGDLLKPGRESRVWAATEETGSLAPRRGVSAMRSREELLAYMASRAATLKKQIGPTIVEMRGKPSGDRDFDHDAGAVLVHPSRILSARALTPAEYKQIAAGKHHLGGDTKADRLFWKDRLGKQRDDFARSIQDYRREYRAEPTPEWLARQIDELRASGLYGDDGLPMSLGKPANVSTPPEEDGLRAKLLGLTKKADAAIFPGERTRLPGWLNEVAKNPMASTVGLESNEAADAREAQGIGPITQLAEAATDPVNLALMAILRKVK